MTFLYYFLFHFSEEVRLTSAGHKIHIKCLIFSETFFLFLISKLSAVVMISTLTFTMLSANSVDDKLTILFLIYPRK